MPGRPEGNRNESKDDSRSSRAHWDSETGWRTSFTGVRAKSANAILSTSPFCAPVKDQVISQTETDTQLKDAENQAEGKHKLVNKNEVDGGIETKYLTNAADVINSAKQPVAGRSLDENPSRADTVPYLSIGTNHDKPRTDDFNQQSTDGQRSQTVKVLGRISTWPLTAVQWQARCKMKEEEEEEEGSDVFTAWTPKSPDEVKTELKHPSGSDQDKKEDEIEKNLKEDLKILPKQDPPMTTVAPMKLGHTQSSEPNEETTSVSEALSHTGTRREEHLKEQNITTDPETMIQTRNLNQDKPGPNQDLKAAENPAHKNSKRSGNRAEHRSESKRAVTSRQRAPKAPSGGASPDDETLLSGNEYAFMDLLHEVVQNNGRWTRERWKQVHVNKQRRQDRTTEGV
ncbi:uncharacterized protein LOC121944707 [Plectropomus leopardus]|uniref:uncharacterized protein LOC121944707 n=1 Tax=Plectropomus leopardus TaxID=160734 RepID=UPI001C4DC267|nr:uncharacterized protein LOC121944707 [Plectropomus leopardus]